MIKLMVDPWCDECPDLEANVEKNTLTYTDFYFEKGEEHETTHTIITCENRSRCNRIRSYVEKNRSALNER